MAGKFRVGVSQEVVTADGGTIFGEDAMKILDDPAIEWEILADRVPALTPEHAARWAHLTCHVASTSSGLTREFVYAPRVLFNI